MILNSTKFGGNRTKDVEVGPDRRTDGQTGRFLYTPPNYVCGGYKNCSYYQVPPSALIYLVFDKQIILIQRTGIVD
jgi:hypothetical protein